MKIGENGLDRIPSARELTNDEMRSLRAVVANSFVPVNQMSLDCRRRLMDLGLIQNAMGGLMPTPSGKIVARL
jgi:hypothetical protein